MTDHPYSVSTLALRWGCSEGLIRNMIRRGELGHIRLGTLIRIPACEIERVECPTTPCSDSEVDTQSSGEILTSEDIACVLRLMTEQERRQRRVGSGVKARVLNGPWGQS